MNKPMIKTITNQKPYKSEVLKFKNNLETFASVIREYKIEHNCTIIDAYNFAENQHERLFGSRKFASYNSFKTSAASNHNIKL
jgi:hypothetical protein